MMISSLGLAAVMVASPVSAAPDKPPQKQEAAERVSYTDNQKSDDPAAKSAWIELASPTPARHGREFITIGDGTGPMTHLRINADRGRPIVRSVRIHYSDGKQRVVRIDSVLGGKQPSALVDLRGARAIDHIVVVTDYKSKGTYTVHGAPPQATESIATR